MSSNAEKIQTGRLLLRIKNRASKRRILAQAVKSFFDNDLVTSSAAITYFGVLVFFPALLLGLSLTQRFFGDWLYHDILLRLRAFMPGSYEFVERNLEAISQVSTGILIAAFSVLLWAGSWIFSIIERAMCRMWGTCPRSFWHGRLLTVGMIAAIGLVLMASLLATSGLIAVERVAERLPVKAAASVAAVTSLAWQSVFGVLSLLLTSALFMLIYLVMPNEKVRVIEVVPGALIAGVLWEVAKYAFAWTIPYFHYDLLYGTIGAGVALLTWGYISTLIMFFGAQLTAVLHCRALFSDDMERECLDGEEKVER
jgi:membrane protein